MGQYDLHSGGAVVPFASKPVRAMKSIFAADVTLHDLIVSLRSSISNSTVEIRAKVWDNIANTLYTGATQTVNLTANVDQDVTLPFPADTNLLKNEYYLIGIEVLSVLGGTSVGVYQHNGSSFHVHTYSGTPANDLSITDFFEGATIPKDASSSECFDNATLTTFVNSTPDVPTSLAVQDNNNTPSFSSFVADPDGDTVQAIYRVYQGAIPTLVGTVSSGFVGSGNTATAIYSAGLGPGEYTLTASAKDTLGEESAESASVAFSVTAPVEKTLSIQWDVGANVTKTLTAQWQVDAVDSVTVSLQMDWSILESVDITLNIAYSLAGVLSVPFDINWSVAVNVEKALTFEWEYLVIWYPVLDNETLWVEV